MQKDNKETTKEENIIKINEGMETEVVIKVKVPEGEL